MTTRTIHTFSYRFMDSETGKPKTSKLSLDIGIYKTLKANEEILFEDIEAPSTVRGKDSTKTDWWLYSIARSIKETKPQKEVTGYLREAAVTKIIDADFLAGYEVNPEYIKVMCSKDDSSNTAVRLPSSLVFALKTIWGREDYERMIQEQYSTLRKDDSITENYSFILRHNLLKIVADPMIDVIL